MAVYKRGGVWWYNFVFRGERCQESTKQGNKRVAEQMEVARKTQLAKGEVGIQDRKPVPTLKDFEKRFMGAIEIHCGHKPGTVRFYRETLTRPLEYEPLANARLNRIDEALIESLAQKRRESVAPATVNRGLATLRRLLRLAYEWKVIDRLPRIHMLPGEKINDFVLSPEQESVYLRACPQPLGDVALLLLDTGLRIGEALALQWRDVQLKPVTIGRFGFLQVREGKSRNARRNVPLTTRAINMLRSRQNTNDDPYVFTAPSGEPYVGTSLDHLHQRVRTKLKLPKDFVLHGLRHTMLTRLGEAGADAFSIMRIAGHSSVTISQRYVHPSSETMKRAFDRLEALNLARDSEHEPTTASATVGEIEAA
jgi:integrase